MHIAVRGSRAVNTRIDYRWGAGNADEMRKIRGGIGDPRAGCFGSHGRGERWLPLLQATRTIPIVFANVPDPVGSGFVEVFRIRVATPPGFVQFEYNLSGKWLEFLKQIAPNVTNAAILWDPTILAG